MNCNSLSRLCYFSQTICKHHITPVVLSECSIKTKKKFSRQLYMQAPKGDPIDAYLKTKQKYESKKLPPNVNPRGVFACNELDLEEVNVYGFDYDYTLAVYKPSMDFLLYNLARDTLISQYKYPRGIKDLEYKPGFAIRGLHYDIEKGLLMKIDSFLQIQLGTVYRGLSPVSDEEVLRLYKNRIIPLAYVETHGKNAQYVTSKMVQLADMFSVPEMCLLCNITEYFIQNGIDFHPEILFRDVKNSVGSSHPVMHKILQEDVSKYIEKNPGITYFFQRLVDAGKKLFLVTNSPYKFVNKGMSWMVGENWEDFFDVIIVQARKPLFFTDESRPLRIYDKENNSYLWDKVTELKKGVIYFEGTINQLKDMTGWYGSEVLYFGDHPYSDLADVTLEHGWRTGAIINELVHEIETLNDEHFKRTCNWLQMLTQLIEDWQDSEYLVSVVFGWQHEIETLNDEHFKRTCNWLQMLTQLIEDWQDSEYLVSVVFGWQHEIETLNDEHFKRTCNWLQMLTQLIEDWQDSEDPKAVEAIQQWIEERDRLRQSMKCVFNKQFGSVFRTYHNPTYFSRRLFRFADIYTSHITNLLQYSVNHTFYPRRGVMPHEYISYFV